MLHPLVLESVHQHEHVTTSVTNNDLILTLVIQPAGMSVSERVNQIKISSSCWERIHTHFALTHFALTHFALTHFALTLYLYLFIYTHIHLYTHTQTSHIHTSTHRHMSLYGSTKRNRSDNPPYDENSTTLSSLFIKIQFCKIHLLQHL